jgi:hypothetical protein
LIRALRTGRERLWSRYHQVAMVAAGNQRRRTHMTDNTEAPTTANGKAPTHAAYHVRDNEGGKGYWTRIGGAWPHRDGKGFNIQTDLAPYDGRITVRLIEEKH